jgi:tetratricopeptide (TPR) repeat protein
LAHIEPAVVERLLAGALSAEETRAVQEHLATCPACQKRVGVVGSRIVLPTHTPGGSLAQTVVRSDSGALERPSPKNNTPVPMQLDSSQAVDASRANKMGRYILLERLGAGGMGVVYAAYDPELDRKVALKLLRPDATIGAKEGQARLLREAQAMAKVVHPNIVAVHDVGTFGDEVFITMDFVEGRNAAVWLSESPHPWREVLEAYVRAGRGLAAAHATGLVHRDFKPDNVLIGKDGSVRVTDFGLATTASGAASVRSTLPGNTPLPIPRPDVPFERPLTMMGAVMGTPGYMSPEQHMAGPADARSDQFSFCASLYEALYGVKPFAGDSPMVIAVEVTKGRVRPPPKESAVPAWVWKIMQRGLSTDPAARWPDLTALLDELSRDPSVRKRRIGVAAAGVGVALAVVFGVYRVGQAKSALCTGAERRLAGVWDRDRKEAIRAAFDGTGQSSAGVVFNVVEAYLDAWARDYVSAHTDACEATRIRGDQSDKVLGLRMACLDDRLLEARALSDLFLKAEARTIDGAAGAAQGLSGFEGCADLKLLDTKVRPPPKEKEEAVAKVRRELADAKALRNAGRPGKALEAYASAAADAKAIGYGPLEADALLRRGQLESEGRRFALAEKSVASALFLAESEADDNLAAQAAVQLVWIEGHDLKRYDDARRWAGLAEAIVHRLGGSQPLEGRLLLSQGVVAADERDYPTAERLLGQALELLRKSYGEDNPATTGALTQLAQVQYDARHPEKAEELYLQALERAQARGPDHPALIPVLSGLAKIQQGRGEREEAVKTFERALAISEKRLGPEHPQTAITESYLGEALFAAGKLSSAATHCARSVEIFESLAKKRGEAHPSLGAARGTLAMVLLREGKSAEALAQAERAIAVLEKSSAPDEKSLAYFRGMAGRALLGLSRTGAAQVELEAALAGQEKTRSDPAAIAETRFALAQALWSSPRERPRARHLAQEARNTIAAEPTLVAKRAEMDAWIAAHR